MRMLRQELYFPIIVAVHFGLWVVDLSLYSGSFHDVDSDTFLGAISMAPGQLHPSRVLGEVFSSWVVTVFAFNFLMATRARWVERIFGGLDKMYVIHRRSGVIAVVLLLAHFLTVPRDLTAFTPGKPLGFYALLLILIGVVLSAVPALKRRLPYHRWLPIHRLMGVFYAMGIAHAFLVHSLIWELPLTRAYVFGMSSVGLLAWLYRTLIYRWHHPPIAATVASAEDVGSGVLDLRLATAGTSLDFEPGQFAFLTVPTISSESHPFTLACAPGGDLRFLIKDLGDYTGSLARAITAGTAVQVDGPFGHFVLRHTRHRSQVWIAGGIGVTPFLSLLADVGDHEVTLVWSVATEADAFCADTLTRRAEEAGVTLALWSTAERGYLSADALGLEAWTETSFLLCGPPGLKDALQVQLRTRGVHDDDIHDEAFAFR